MSTVEHVVKVRADQTDDSASRNQWLIFFSLNLIVFGLAVFGPQSYHAEGTAPIVCPKTIYKLENIECGPFDIITNPVFSLKTNDDISYLNQFLLLYGFPEKENINDKLDSVELHLLISIYRTDNADEPLSKVAKRITQSIKFDCQNDKSYCQPEEIAIVSELTWDQDSRYIFVIQITNGQEITKVKIKDFIVAFLYSNWFHVIYYIVIRYSILLISLVSFIVYHSKLSQLQKSYISSEQTQLWWLGIVTIFLNDPIVLITYTHRSLLFSGLAMLSILTFTALLFYFWLSTSDKLVNGGKIKNRLLNVILVILLYFTALLVYGNLTVYSAHHPLIHYSNYDSETFEGSKYAFYGALGLCLLILFIRYIRIFCKGSNATSRESVFFLYTSFFTVVYSCFLYSGTIEIYHDNKVRQILLFGLVNLYLLFMHYSYSPLGNGEIELVRLPGGESSRLEETRGGKLDVEAPEGEEEDEENDEGDEDEEY